MFLNPGWTKSLELPPDPPDIRGQLPQYSLVVHTARTTAGSHGTEVAPSPDWAIQKIEATGKSGGAIGYALAYH